MKSLTLYQLSNLYLAALTFKLIKSVLLEPTQKPEGELSFVILQSIFFFVIGRIGNSHVEMWTNLNGFRHTIQYTVEDEVAYISAATSEFPHRICFKFLGALIQEYQSAVDTDSPQGQGQFQAFIKDRLVRRYHIFIYFRLSNVIKILIYQLADIFF